MERVWVRVGAREGNKGRWIKERWNVGFAIVGGYR